LLFAQGWSGCFGNHDNDRWVPVPPHASSSTPSDQFQFTFAVNVTPPYIFPRAHLRPVALQLMNRVRNNAPATKPSSPPGRTHTILHRAVEPIFNRLLQAEMSAGTPANKTYRRTFRWAGLEVGADAQLPSRGRLPFLIRTNFMPNIVVAIV
jgi:hypothetical protein